MRHIMVDIETLGNKPSAAVLSIGACYFDPDSSAIGRRFHVSVCAESCIEHGLSLDVSTVLWWLGQSNDARSSLLQGQNGAPYSLTDALTLLSHFIGNPNHRVWGNGATFDNAILKNAYEATGIEVPWKFWCDRDVRTIVELGQAVGFDPKRDMPFVGVKHDALSDAVHQAKYVSAIWRRLTHVARVRP